MRRKLLSLVMALAVMCSVAWFPKYTPYAVHASVDYGSEAIADYARQVAAIVNRERAANGLSPLKYSDRLSEPALIRATEIQSSFSHTRPNGSSCFTAITEAGINYRSAGENIAYGQRDPEDVMNAWMNSEGHRANILRQDFEFIGVGVTYKNGTYYWSQFFASSNDLTGEVLTVDGLSATTQATAATTKATAATTKATAATTKATAATTKATAATTKATAATIQATSATTKATSATTQATTPTTATCPKNGAGYQIICNDSDCRIVVDSDANGTVDVEALMEWLKSMGKNCVKVTNGSCAE